VIKRTDLNTVVLPTDGQDALDTEAVRKNSLVANPMPEGPSRKSSVIAHAQPVPQMQLQQVPGPAPMPERVTMTAEAVFAQNPRRSSIPDIDLQYGGNYANAEFSGHVAQGEGNWNPVNGLFGQNNFVQLPPNLPPQEMVQLQPARPVYAVQQTSPIPMQAPPPAVTEFTYEPVAPPRATAQQMYQGGAYNGYGAQAQDYGDNWNRGRMPSEASNEPGWL
jgi:hypothetical protein